MTTAEDRISELEDELHRAEKPASRRKNSTAAFPVRGVSLVPPFYLFFISFLLGSHPAMLRGDSWLCTQELPLAVLRGPYGMLGIEPGSAARKANAVPSVLPQSCFP